jgi:hypothetical protein
LALPIQAGAIHQGLQPGILVTLLLLPTEAESGHSVWITDVILMDIRNYSGSQSVVVALPKQSMAEMGNVTQLPEVLILKSGSR